MIRSLLCSTVLLSAMILNTQVNADPVGPTPTLATPQIKFQGQTSFNSFFFRNKRIFQAGDLGDSDCKRRKFGRGQLFTVDSSRLRISVDGRTDPGMEYGLVFVLNGDVNSGNTLRENYLYFSGTWGQLYAGDTFGVEGTMAFGGWDQWGGTGFIEGGRYDRVVNYTTGTVHSVDLIGDTSRDTKLTYLTPRWKGVQVGVSYTPRTAHRGEQKIEARRSESSPKEPFGTDNIASGINFIHKFTNGFEMALSATSVFAKTHSEYRLAPLRKNVASYAFGATFNYSDVGFSVEYGNNGRSQDFKQSKEKSNSGQWVDFGLSYKWSASTKLSAGYYYAWRKALNGTVKVVDNKIISVSNTHKSNAKTNGVMAAIDHKLAPGLGVYFEYANLQMKNPAAVAEGARVNQVLQKCGDFIGPVKNNQANVFILGSRLVF
ncbi:MAG: porin [Alphaproteobacteria bacterium]|nr:porin [Alphaproteobacteria bacterium]